MKTEPTDALKLIENSNTKVEDHNDENFYFESEVKEAIHVAFSEGQSSPKIKQLEWEYGLYNTLVSKTLIGDYGISPMKDGYHMYLCSKNQYYWLKDYASTIEEAKSAAQEDFENRVKQCLEL